MMARRYERSVAYQPVGVDTSAAQMQGQLAGVLADFSQRAGARYAQARAMAGAEAGTAAGARGDITRRSELTAYGRSYNQTMVEAHRAAVDTDVRVNLARIAKQYENDSAGFDAAVDGYTKGLTKTIDPGIAPQVTQFITLQRETLGQKIRDAEQKLNITRAHGEIQSGLETLISLSRQQARDGDIEGMTDTHGRIQELISNNTLSPENPTGFFDPVRTPALLAGTKDDLDENLLIGQVDRTTNNAQTRQILERLNKTPLTELDLNPDVRDRVAAHAERLINKREAEQEAKLSESRSLLQERERDDLAQYATGVAVENPLRKADYVQVYGEEEGSRRFAAYEKDRQVGEDISTFSMLSDVQIQERISARAPQSGTGYAAGLQRQQSMMKAAQQVLRMRDTDPALSVSSSPAIETALESSDPQMRIRALLSEQQRVGILDPKPLTNAQAEQIVASFGSGTEDSAALMNTLRQQYGDYWPQVFGQLAENGLPPTALVIGAGIPQRAANALVTVSQLKDDELKARMAATAVEWRDIEDRVDGQLEDLAARFGPEGAATFNSIRSSAQKLTAAYIAQGSSLGDAADKAARDLANERYAFQAFRGHMYRVPAEIDPDIVDDGATAALEAFRALSGTVPEVPGQPEEVILGQATEAVRRRGYWVTTPDESGLRLYLNGQPVPGGNRRPVDYSWADLEEIAEKSLAERQKRQAEEAARRAERSGR